MATDPLADLLYKDAPVKGKPDMSKPKKKSDSDDDFTAADLAAANAEGMTPSEYQAAYASPQASNQASGEAPNTSAPAPPLPPPNEFAAADAAVNKASKAATTPAQPSAWETLANDLASSYMADTNAMNSMASGQSAASVDAGASQQAAADLGQGAASPVSAWLQGQTGAAAAQNSGVAAAEANTEKAVQSGANMVNQGLQGMGTAETAELQAAPYTQLLNSLAQSVPYHVSESWNIPGLTSLPAGIKQAETDVGVTTAGQGTGAVQAGLGAPQTAAGGAPPVTTTTTPYNPVTGS